MLRTGDMARAGGGRLMKICDITNDVAVCLWFDGRGAIHEREYQIWTLRPFWLATGPRTLWPEVNDLPEEPRPTVLATMRRSRRVGLTRSKPSRKIKRGKAKSDA